METNSIGMAGAVLAGMMSFLSPCVLPLIPSYLTYLTGLSLAELQVGAGGGMRRQVLLHSLCYIAGFTCVFMLLGVSASLAGDFLLLHKTAIRRCGGVLIALFGMQVAGLLKADLLLGEKRFSFAKRPAGYFGSYLVGVVFAAGWTPCIGPILATILTLAATEGRGVWLLGGYSAGMAVPFFLAALATERFLAVSRTLKRYLHHFELATGALMVLIGVLVFGGYLPAIGRCVGGLFAS